MNQSTRTRKIVNAVKSARTRAVLSLGIVLGLTAVSTMAYWSDQATLTTGTIQTGKLDLLINNGLAGQGGTVSATDWNIANMVPGESVAGTVSIGRATDSVGFTYTVSAAEGTGATGLGSFLKWRVTNGNVVGTGRAKTCDGTEVMAARSLTTAATSVTSGSLSGTTFSTRLCIEAVLPASVTDWGAMGKTSSGVLTFAATQLS